MIPDPRGEEPCAARRVPPVFKAGIVGRFVFDEAVARLGAMGADVSHPVIVGDSIWDVRGGHEAGIPVIGVGWGYATEDGLDDAEVVCETVEDLRALLMPAGC